MRLLKISIHAPREGSDSCSRKGCAHQDYFNPRSPRGERPFNHPRRINLSRFQSTLPARGATNPCQTAKHHQLLFQSTLPARGATISRYGCTSKAINFNPRSPRGERLAREWAGNFSDKFQSTLPARGATSYTVKKLTDATNFNPRSPRGERPAQAPVKPLVALISIHAPREGSDD